MKPAWGSSVLFHMVIYATLSPGAGSSFAQTDTRLIVRGDDFGMTEGSLEAFEQAFENGVLTCGGLMAPAPWFEGAADLSKAHPKWCVGVHLAVIAEWQGYRWRPVLPWDKVRSIVDENGYLYTSPAELLARNPKLEEIVSEFRAQIDLALKYGVNVQYLDLHYFSGDAVEGLDQALEKIGRDYGLPFSGGAGEDESISVYIDPVDEKLENAVKQLEELKPGLCLWVSHIGIDSPEQNALIHGNPKDRFSGDGVGRHRAAELQVLVNPEVKAVIEKRKIRLVNYGEFQQREK